MFIEMNHILEMVGINLERIDHLNKSSNSRNTVKLFFVLTETSVKSGSLNENQFSQCC